MPVPPRVFFLIHQAHAALMRAADRQSRSETGLSMTQQGVLFLLDEQDGRTASELAGALSLSKSSLSGLIDRMVDKGLVRREGATGDGRVVRLFISDTARALVARARPLIRAQNTALLAPFSTEEQAVIARFLTHVRQNADAISGRDQGERRDGH